MQGKIKRWMDDKNFGFIDIGEEKDLFFHRNELTEGYVPEEGDQVDFEKAQGDKGPMAVKVKKAGESTEEPVEETSEEESDEESKKETSEEKPASETQD